MTFKSLATVGVLLIVFSIVPGCTPQVKKKEKAVAPPPKPPIERKTTRVEKPEQATDLFTPQPKRILKNKSFDDSDEARQEILKLFKDLRVPDVSDGMDAIGLQDIGAMDRRIRPLWRDLENFSHRFVGFAVTVRYVPAQLRVGQNSFANYAEYAKFKKAQYKQSGEKQWKSLGRRGDAVVVFDAEDVG